MKGLTEFAAQHLGLELHGGQKEVLGGWSDSGKSRAVLCLGRRSGKGVMGAVAAIHNAIVPDYTRYLRPGETRFIIVVATRVEQAREFVRVVRELLANAPDGDLAALVDDAASTQDEVVFRSGVVIRAMPCSSRSVRGMAASLVIFDEAAHFMTDTEGPAAFRAVWRALVPSTAQFRELGYTLVTSTPLWPSGWFYDLVRAGESGSDKGLHVVRRPTWQVVDNPHLSGYIDERALAGEFAADPDGARVEYGAEFVQGLGAFLDADKVLGCVVRGRKWVPVVPGTRYVAAIDPAFAAAGDFFTLAICHLEDEGTAVLDFLQAWRGKASPLSSDVVLDEVTEHLLKFNVHEVISDQFAVVPIADGLARRHIHLNYQPLTSERKADIYTALKRRINLETIELLDDPQLIAELNRLEVRPSAGGKPRIQGGGGFHDDRAMAVASAVAALVGDINTTDRLRLFAREVYGLDVPEPYFSPDTW